MPNAEAFTTNMACRTLKRSRRTEALLEIFCGVLQLTTTPETADFGMLALMTDATYATEKLTDEAIVQQIVQGDVNAFEMLLKRYQGYVLKIVANHVPSVQVEDVAHEAFIRAYKSLPTFKQTSSFKAWLSSVAVRTCYDFWRKQYRSKEIPQSSLSEEQQHWVEAAVTSNAVQSFTQEADLAHARETLEWALNSLSAEDRMVVELIYLEELSGKDAAKLLGWSVANVKVRAFRARKKLQKILSGVLEITIHRE